jgi:hypothetical protein
VSQVPWRRGNTETSSTSMQTILLSHSSPRLSGSEYSLIPLTLPTLLPPHVKYSSSPVCPRFASLSFLAPAAILLVMVDLHHRRGSCSLCQCNYVKWMQDVKTRHTHDSAVHSPRRALQCAGSGPLGSRSVPEPPAGGPVDANVQPVHIRSAISNLCQWTK